MYGIFTPPITHAEGVGWGLEPNIEGPQALTSGGPENLSYGPHYSVRAFTNHKLPLARGLHAHQMCSIDHPNLNFLYLYHRSHNDSKYSANYLRLY